MTAVERSDVTVPRHGAAVPGNRWDLLVPPPDHTWTPTATVSICIPSRNASGLSRTLAALGAQTYPLDLVEVVVVDDGSDPPLDLGDRWAFPLRVIRTEPIGRFGAGRARNAAAAAADGEILMFLDADVVPERQVVEAYARWFERCPVAVPIGLCRFVDMDDLTTDELVTAVAEGTMAERFARRDVDDQSWRERVFARTDDLRVEAVDAFRIVIGATLAVSARQFRTVGGFRDLGIRGIEDTELGYRLHADGAVLILDRDANHWHQGGRSLDNQRAAIKAARDPYVQRLLPLPGFRRVASPPDGPVDTVPVLLVHIDPAGAPPGAVDAMAERIERHCGTDARITASAGDLHAFQPSFAAMSVPATMHWDASTLPTIVETLMSRDVGVIRVLRLDGGEPVDIFRTRALRRAVHVLDGAPLGPGALTGCVTDLFGAWWAHPAHLGLAPADEPALVDEELREQPSDVGVLVMVIRRVCRLAYRVARKVLRMLAA